ncbi:MAG: Cu(I)-responsive transcriptional regulator [Pseudomonadota bacterium]
MKISQAARLAELPVKTVRYYADVGLVKPDGRNENGYRDYDLETVRKLTFVRRARSFDFSIDECRELLDLFEDKSRSSSDVKHLTLEKLSEIKARMRELQRLHDELANLANACSGDDRADCPIIDSFASGAYA